MKTIEETSTVSAPVSESIAKVPAKPAKPAKAPAKAPTEGAGGKGSVHPEISRAQRADLFRRDSAALADVLKAMGADVTTQASKKGVVFCWRIAADLKVLRINRDKASGTDRRLAAAALEAFESMVSLRPGAVRVGLTLWADTAMALASRKARVRK